MLYVKDISLLLLQHDAHLAVVKAELRGRQRDGLLRCFGGSLPHSASAGPFQCHTFEYKICGVTKKRY